MEITVSIVERRWTVFVMAEYIEREAAIKLIAEDKVEITPILCAITPTYTAEQAFDGLNQSCDRHIKFINSIPSADVQPVVKCKDCRYRDPEDHKCDSGQLERAGCLFPVDDNYFCAYGERMDGDNNG